MEATLIVVLLVFGGAFLGFFCTKTSGWGKFSTSALLIILVLFVASIGFVLQKIEFQNLTNLLFAIAGFAGAMLTGKEDPERTTAKKD